MVIKDLHDGKDRTYFKICELNVTFRPAFLVDHAFKLYCRFHY